MNNERHHSQFPWWVGVIVNVVSFPGDVKDVIQTKIRKLKEKKEAEKKEYIH
jgi:hypothetical protein